MMIPKLHRTNTWVRSSYVCAYAYVYVAAVFTSADAYACAYALVKTSLASFFKRFQTFLIQETLNALLLVF